jgi:hypothetical protein
VSNTISFAKLEVSLFMRGNVAMMKATWETNSLAEPMDDSGRCSPAPDAL